MKKKPNDESEELQRLKKFLREKEEVGRSGGGGSAAPKGSFGRLTGRAQSYVLEWRRQYWKPHNKYLAMITAFMAFSTYVCYKMEKQYYLMKQRVDRTQSFKQMQIDKEKKYIDKMLRREEFESVPITEEYQPKIKYKFEQFEDEELDTKNEMLQAIRDDFLKGQSVPDQYAQDFFKAYPDLKARV